MRGVGLYLHQIERVSALIAKHGLDIDFIHGELPHFSSTLVRGSPANWRAFLPMRVAEYLDQRPELLAQLVRTGAAPSEPLAPRLRSASPDVAQALSPLADTATWLAVTAERAVSRTMGGSCSMPLAAHAIWRDGVLHLQAAWGDPAGSPVLVRAEVKQALDANDPQSRQIADQLGEAVAAQLRAQGAH
jgi:hypothetical protein